MANVRGNLSWIGACVADLAAVAGITLVLTAVVAAGLAVRGRSLSEDTRGALVLQDGSVLRFRSGADYRALRDAHRGRIARATFEQSAALSGAMRGIFPLVYAGGFAYVAFRERRRLQPWLRATPRRVALGVALGTGTALSSLLYGWGMARLGHPLEPVALPVRQFGALPFLLVAAVGAPLAEELYFRGRLFRLIEEASGGAAALRITTVIFAVIHVPTLPMALPPYLLVSFALGWQRLRYGGLDGSVATHATHNAIAVAVAMLAGS